MTWCLCTVVRSETLSAECLGYQEEGVLDAKTRGLLAGQGVLLSLHADINSPSRMYDTSYCYPFRYMRKAPRLDQGLHHHIPGVFCSLSDRIRA